MKFLLLIVKNVRRNLLRTALTSLGTIVLVCVVTLVWSVLTFLDQVTQEQSRNLKCIVTERWQLPSQMPFSYASQMEQYAWRDPADEKPLDSMMTWQFYFGTTDPQKRTFASLLAVIALEPRKLYTMMDELETLPASQKAALISAADAMERNRRGVILGRTRLQRLGKRTGDRFTVTGISYRDIDLEFEIVGVFPPGRYDNVAVMNCDYLNAALDDWARKHNGRKHPLADKTLNLVWFRFPDLETFNRVADQITTASAFATPAVKCETLSSGAATWMEPYRDLLWGVRWLLSPAILISLALVMANAISISVRERRQELAVLKVLGFRPLHLLCLVLGEALVLGLLAGLLSAGLTYACINYGLGGVKFSVAWFDAFYISPHAFWWGPAVGIVTALAGSFLPAWAARSVKVTEVFAKVA